MSLPWRVALSLLMIFLAGPALLGLISEYATYWYAIDENVRPPVEGIPYLSATVTLASLALALSVSLMFFLSRLVVMYLVGSVIISLEGYTKVPSIIINLLKKVFTFESHSVEQAFEQINNLPAEFRKLKGVNILIISLLGFLLVLGLSFWQLPEQGMVKAIEKTTYISVYLTIVILSLWRKYVMNILAVIAAIAFYIFSISLLFNHQYYSLFLNYTGFGGGQKITLELKADSSPVEMKLILRSKDWFIGHSLSSGETIEVPQHVVKSIKYNGVKK